MQIIRKIFLTSIALLLGSVALAANDRGLIWKLTNDKPGEKPATAYILGSIHLAREDFYPLRIEIENAFKQSDVLIVEVDITEGGAELNDWLHEHGLYTPPETLRDHLPDSTYQRLVKFIEKENLSEVELLQQRPALLGISVSLYQLNSLGMNPALGLDQHFLKKAHAVNKPIRPLETIQDQLTLLFAFPDDALMVDQLINQSEQLPALVDDMTQAWKNGDSNALAELLINMNSEKESIRFKPLMEAMFYQRNRRMVEKIDQWLKQGGTYFIVVGSGHLIGEQNIIDLLRQRSYTLRRI